MKSKIPLFCCLLFLMISHLRAQTTVIPIKQTRTYSGTITQYVASSQPASGTINMEIDPDGKIAAQTVINGATASYLGALENAPKRKGLGYISLVDAQSQPLSGADKIPLVITKAAVYGGSLDGEGNSITVRVIRGTLVSN